MVASVASAEPLAGTRVRCFKRFSQKRRNLWALPLKISLSQFHTRHPVTPDVWPGAVLLHASRHGAGLKDVGVVGDEPIGVVDFRLAAFAEILRLGWLIGQGVAVEREAVCEGGDLPAGDLVVLANPGAEVLGRPEMVQRQEIPDVEPLE